MDARDIQAYVSRDWDSVRLAKDRYWADRVRRLGAGEGLRVGDELRRHVLSLHPGWPSQADRDADLAHHVKLAGLLRRVGRPGSR